MKASKKIKAAPKKHRGKKPSYQELCELSDIKRDLAFTIDEAQQSRNAIEKLFSKTYWTLDDLERIKLARKRGGSK